MAWYDNFGGALKQTVAGGVSDALEKWGGGSPTAITPQPQVVVPPQPVTYPEQGREAPIGSGNANAVPVVGAGGGMQFNPYLMYGSLALGAVAILALILRK